jgi:hypothetical protein
MHFFPFSPPTLPTIHRRNPQVKIPKADLSMTATKVTAKRQRVKQDE